MKHRSLLVFLVLLLAYAGPSLRAQTKAPCPSAVPSGTACYLGKDGNGAHYLIAMPETWNRVLVMHARGGPYVQQATSSRSLEDIARWTVWVKEGFAYAASQYRRGGYGVKMAAEDTENLRQFFVQQFGEPRRTIMHGQSWGGMVGARVIERLGTGADGKRNYDGALLTSGMLAGGSRGYDFRFDLRIVYQYFCMNHPRPNEPQYPLWMGLPSGSAMTAADLRARVNECTGVQLPPERRSELQRSNLANILGVVRVPERSLQGHMNWSTFLFADIVHNRLGGRNPFSNERVRYKGSGNDAALNAGVLRHVADLGAVAELADDSDPTGKAFIPTLTMHAIDDPTAFVEQESAYLAVRERAGSQEFLVQTFTDESEHSYLSAPEYATLMSALMDWIDNGRKPSVHAIAARCARYLATYVGECRFNETYAPPPFEARVYPRNR